MTETDKVRRLEAALTACQQERDAVTRSAIDCGCSLRVSTQDGIKVSNPRAEKAEADLTACRAQGEAIAAKWRTESAEAVDMAREAEGKGLLVTAASGLERGSTLRECADVLAALSSTPTEPKNDI